VADPASQRSRVSNKPGTAIGPGDWAKALSAIKSKQEVDYKGASGPVDWDKICRFPPACC
jgi:hypothetical protein